MVLKFNLDIVPIFIERKNNVFEMEVFEPIKSSIFKNKFEVSEKLNQIMENMIIRNPNQWIGLMTDGNEKYLFFVSLYLLSTSIGEK